jgi:hypothetical protein
VLNLLGLRERDIEGLLVMKPPGGFGGNLEQRRSGMFQRVRKLSRRRTHPLRRLRGRGFFLDLGLR